MSFTISTIKKNLEGYNRYLFLLGDYHIENRINSFFQKEFSPIGGKIGGSGVIVNHFDYTTDNGKFLFELRDVLKERLKERLDDKNLQAFVDMPSLKKPILLITEENPNKLSKDSFVLSITLSELDKIYEDLQDLYIDIVSYGRQENRHLIDRITKYQHPIATIERNIAGFVNSPEGIFLLTLLA